MRWEARERPDPSCVQHLMDRLNAPRVVAELLCQRGIVEEAQVRKFFKPDLGNTYDPFLMKDMDRAVERLTAAKENGEEILIFGDYDVDGTTAVSLSARFFRTQIKLKTYIPDRHKEGYGISKAGIDFAKDQGIKLIVALDCGIRSVEEVAYASDLGIDFIICDHHLPGKELPKAVAVLDPKRSDCEYPFKELSGCGIGYKLCEAYAQVHDMDPRTHQRFLDLLAVSIAADIVPIEDENRIYAHFGLKVINHSPNLGLRCLAQLALTKEELSIGDLVFYIGPRINAAGRLAHANLAVKLLCSDQEEEAMQLASELHELNAERRAIDEGIIDAIVAQVEGDPKLLARKTMIFSSDQWHKGVIGIAASRVVERYYRPAIILSDSEGVLTGSARSIDGFDIHAALEHCKEHLIQFGGHKYAAGMRLNKEDLEAFKQSFEEYAQAHLTEEQMIPVLRYDLELEMDEVNEVLERSISRMAPFGPGNRTPVFKSAGLRDRGYGKRIGKTQEHVKLQVQAKDRSIDAVGFGLADQWETIKETGPFEACFQISQNTFRGVTNLQLMLKDLRSTNDADSIASSSV